MTNKIKFTLLLLSATLSTLTVFAISDEQKEKYFEAYGWVRGKQSGITQLKPTEKELELFYKGLKAGINDEKPPVEDVRALQSEMNEYFRTRAGVSDPKPKTSSSSSSGSADENKKSGKAFLADLIEKDDKVKKTDSGLHYKVLEAGKGKKPGPRDRVKVHYEGTLINGEVFDSSLKRGNPITFGLNGVIAGWTEGLQLIGEGGKIKLYIPSDLAYGDRGMPSIPAGSTLIFDVELIEIVSK